MRIVYSYYVLDIIHRGHLLLMKNAKAFAGKEGKLVVGILTDKAVMEKKVKPILSFDERMELARAIRYVDVVVPQETYSPIPNIRCIKPDILVESNSHAKKEVTQTQHEMKKLGGKVVIMPYYPDQSSSYIKEKVKRMALEK